MLGADKGTLALGVSGGPDSMALLVLAHAATPGRLMVATVDHGLRAESAGEAAMVARLCAARGIPHETITLSLAGGAGVPERARAARYAALGDWALPAGATALLTAHHADDQAETMVMRLNRGAGVRGLAGMRPRATVPGHPALRLLRPLLGWRRSELIGVLASAGVEAVEDPSNRDERYERARLRAAMTSISWLDISGISRSAAHLAEADAALDWAADRALTDVTGDAELLEWTPDVPRAVTLRVLERIVARFGLRVPRGSAVARWHDALTQGRVATLAGVRGDGRGMPWRFTCAPAHRAR